MRRLTSNTQLLTIAQIAALLITIDFVSPNQDFNHAMLMSKPVILRISDQANEPQRFNGYITGYTLGELATDDMREYQILMVSWF